MAKKEFSKKSINVRETKTASVKPNEADIVKGSIIDFSNTLTMDFASFFLGSAQLGSDMKKAQSSAQANKKSILAGKNSIYAFLEDIKSVLTSKKIKEIIPKSLVLTSANSSLIKDALYLNDESLTHALVRILESINTDTIKIDEEQIKLLKESLNSNIIKFDDKQLKSLKKLFNNQQTNNIIKIDEEQLKSLKNSNDNQQTNNIIKIDETQIENLKESFNNQQSDNIIKIDENQFDSLKDSFNTKQLNDIINNFIGNEKVLFNSMSNDLLLIKNALYNNGESLVNALIRILGSDNTKNESIITEGFNFNKIINSLEQLSNDIISLSDEKLDHLLKRIVEAENKSSQLIESAQNLYNINKNTLESNEKNITNILTSFQTQYEALVKENKEELQNLINTFATDKQNLVDINNQIREDNVNKVVKAKLELMIEGIDTSTIDALIKFSNLNLDSLDQNAKNLINFFNALKVLEDYKLDKSLQNVTMITPILLNLGIQLKFIKLMSKAISDNDITAFEKIITNFGFLIISLQHNEIDKLAAQVDFESISNSFKSLNKILKSLVASIPLISIVNLMYGGHKVSIDLNRTVNVFENLQKLFNTIDQFKPINNAKGILTSFIKLQLINEALVTIGPSIILANKLSLSDETINKYGDVLINIDTLFRTINDVHPIENGFKIIKSLFLYNKINKQVLGVLDDLSKIDKRKFNEDKLKLMSLSLNNISKIFDIINQIKGLDSDTRKKINTIAGFFGVSSGKQAKKINESLQTIFEAINSINLPEQEILTGVCGSVEDIKSIIDNLNAINKISNDPDKILDNVDKYLKVLEESYKKIEEKFDQIIQIGNKVEQVNQANESISKTLENTNETIVKTSSKQEDIKKSVISIEGMTEFMIGAALVMSIGALFVALGGGKFVKNALEFGIVLSIFEGLVLLPALMFSTQENTAIKGLEGFTGFIITCTILMSIGALFMYLSNGEFVKKALEFGITLAIFETLIVAPLIAFGNMKNNVLSSAKDFTGFLITCTLIMSIGALFMYMSNGELAKNGIEFGITLAMFEALVVAPLLLFSLIKSSVFDAVKAFTGLIITCTIVMLVGALFMQNKEFVKGAEAFTLTLMKFEAYIIAPFLLFNLIRKQVFDGLHSFTSTVIVCTTVLLIGALFVRLGGGKFVKSALLFTGVLALFEALIIAPFLLFNGVKREVFGGMKDFAVVVFVATTVLMIGSVFMTTGNGKYAWAALQFTGLIASFVTLTALPMRLFNKVSTDALKGAKDFGVFIALSSFSLLIGAYFVAKYGSESVIEYAKTLGKFVAGMSLVMFLLDKGIRAAGGEKTVLSETIMLGSFLLMTTISLALGAIMIDKYGWKPVWYAGLLLGFVGLLGGVFVAISWGFKAVGGSVKVIAEMAALGSFILMSSVSLALGAFIIDKYGWDKPLIYAGVLVGFIGLIGLVFVGLGALSIFIAPGAIAAAAMGVALLTLTGSLMIINYIFDSDKDGKKLKSNIKTLMDIIDGDETSLKNLFDSIGGPIITTCILLGSAGAIAMSVALLALSGSLFLVHKILEYSGGKEALTNDITALNEVISVDMALLIGKVILIGAEATIGLVALAPLSLFIIGLSGTITAMSAAMWGLRKSAGSEDFKNQIDNIVNNLQMFLDIPDKIDLGGMIGALQKGGKILQIRSFSKSISEILSSLSRSIQDMANMKVAEDWDEKGNPTKFRQLTTEDFNLAKDNIGKLLITMTDAFVVTWNGKGNIQGLSKITNDKNGAVHKTINFGKSIGEVISNSAKGVSDMANLVIGYDYDKDGKPTKYRSLTQTDFSLAGENIGLILRLMADALVDVWWGTKGKPGLWLIAIGKDSPLPQVIEFSKSVGGVISAISDSIIKLASAQIPTKWDKDGKVIEYSPINIPQVQANLTKVIGSLMTAMALSLITVANQNKEMFDDGEDSPFMIAVKGMNNMTQTVSGIVDSVIKLGSAQIATEWDPKTGKAIHYEKINVDETVKNIKKILVGKTGLLNILCSVINDVYDTWFDDNDLTEKTEPVLKGITNITKTIGTAADLIIKLASGKIPVDFGKDGKATSYEKLNVGHIIQGQIFSMILLTSILSIFNNDTINGYVNNKEQIDKAINILNISIKSLGNITDNALKQIQQINKFKSQIESFANLDFNKIIDNLSTSTKKMNDCYNSMTFDSSKQIEFQNAMNELSNYIKNTITPFDDDLYVRSNNLHSSIEKIYKSISKQVDKSKQFKSNTNALQNYIKAVNSVNIAKLKPLTTLVIELNKLANKLGGLDKLTSTLSNELAIVLKNLVDSLNEAKTTINSAHQLQGDRHNKIEEAINKVRSLMEYPLKINVSTESSSTTGPNSIVTPENNKQNSSSSPIILSGGSGGSNGGSNRNNSNTPPTRKNN